MIRIGLIGAGWHALADHAPALRHCADSDDFRGQVKLSGVFDIDRAKATDAVERFGFGRAHDSIESLLRDVDAAICVVPPAALPTSVEIIMRHRRPALIEKPLGCDLTEARRLAGILDGYPHMVSLNRRFDPAVQIARKWMAARPSPPRAVRGIMMRRDRDDADFAWSTGIHLTDLLCFLVGPLRLTRGRRDRCTRIGNVVGEGAIHGVIEISPASGRVEESIDLTGDGWSARVDLGTHQPWRVICRRGDAIEIDQRADATTAPFIRNGTADETSAFLRGVLHGTTLAPTVADAMPGTALAAAMQALNDAPAYHETPK